MPDSIAGVNGGRRFCKGRIRSRGMIHLQQLSDDAKDVVSDKRVVGAGLNAPEGATDIKLKVDKADTDFATSLVRGM